MTSPMPTLLPSRRLLSMDILRVMAIVMVIMQHACPIAQHTPQHTAWHFINGAAVDILFMISGTLLLPVSGPYGKFYLRRFFHVGIPFLLWTIIYLLLWHYVDGASTHDTIYAAKRILWQPTFPPGWFAYTILGAYLFMPFISPWIASATRRQYHWFILLWGLSLTLPYLYARWGARTDSLGLLGLFYNYFGFTVIGAYFHRYPPYRYLSRARLWSLVVGLLAGGAALNIALYGYATRNLFTHLLLYNDRTVALAAVACAIYIAVTTLCRHIDASDTRYPRLRATFRFLSVYSFGVYLIHHAVIVYLFSRYWPDACSSLLFPAGTVAVSLAAAVIIRHIPFIGRYFT